MHDHAAFLAAIVAAPDDDLPRLVYADFLDECGEPGAAARAEFIRLQCELERCSVNDDRRAALRERADDLRRGHARVWVRELRRAQLGLSKWTFRRGFLHAVAVPAQRFPDVAGPLFRLAPTVRAVTLVHGSGTVKRLIETPDLAKVAELNITQMCTCGLCPILAELRSLFASPLLARLTHLTVAKDRIDAETLTALVASPHLRTLQSLDLSQNDIGLAGVRVLAAGGFTQLRELNLRVNGISASGGQVLARAAWLKGLRTLNLSGNRLTDTSGRALLNADFGDGLASLNVQRNEFTAGMHKLLRAKFGAAVRA
jgi:uncharacterized protein (TIGR02996 family)